jgi:large subunit ribosomal protein L46
MPFTRYFYFKKDTPAMHDWKLKARDRAWQPARELGGYDPHSDVAWNDELLVGDKLSSTKEMVESIVQDGIPRAVEGKGGVERMEAMQRPLKRVTDADRRGDEGRLDRKLNRTLYLCVRREKGGWGFPAGELDGRENLRDVSSLSSYAIFYILSFSGTDTQK